MEKFTRETLSIMTQEELIEVVETLQVKLEALQKENQELKHYADIGKKYEEYLKTEVTKLVKIVEGENSPVLKLVDRADIETLQELEKSYREKAKEELKPSSRQGIFQEDVTAEKLENMSYKELLKLREKFKEVG